VFFGHSRLAAILWLSGFALLFVVLGGCGPALSQSDLGKVVTDLPQVAGADKPYQIPQLGPPLPPGPGSEGDQEEPE
jgi:hypothetical protein